MEKLFLTVLGMSGTAAVVILLVLLARLALRRAPKVFSYALWAVVLFRLLCPFTIPSTFSLLPAVQTSPAGAELTRVTVYTGIAAVNIPVNDYLSEHPYPVEFTQSERKGDPCAQYLEGIGRMVGTAAPDWVFIACRVWLAGAVLLLGYGAVSLLILRRRLVGSVPLAGEKHVRLADHIPSPFVLGLFRPRIYLPSDLPEEERDYILLHERTHIRRGDHVFRALAWLALAVHWFNPLVWLAFHLAGKDMEMSCDEAVLRKMGRDVRADYSSSLLRLSTGRRLPAGPLAFGGGDPQSRIKNVLRYKKPALWVIAAALILVLCAGAALATNPGVVLGSPEPAPIEFHEPGLAETWLDTGFPDSVEPFSPTADLTFTMDESDPSGPVVRIDGAVSGVKLTRGAFWYPEQAVWGEHPMGELSMIVPAFTDEIAGHVFAWWTDETHTSVTVSTKMSALLSSLFNVGWWEFTVDLSNGGTVTEMTAHPLRDVPGQPDRLTGETRMYPASITDAEAVQAALVAAKLMTAAEDYYNNARPSVAEPLPIQQVLSYHCPDDGNRLIVDGLGAYVEWDNVRHGEGTPENAVGILNFAGDPAFFCPSLAGTAVEGNAGWMDRDGTVLYTHFTVKVNRAAGGTLSGFTMEFIADLSRGTATQRAFLSDEEGETLELTDQEMADMARVLAQVLDGAEAYFYDAAANGPTNMPVS